MVFFLFVKWKQQLLPDANRYLEKQKSRQNIVVLPGRNFRVTTQIE